MLIRRALALSMVVVAFGGLASAGPLDPPAGAVTPTPGPEPRVVINAANTPGDANSLFRISQPGSYYLNANITGVSGRHGIEIASGGVTIDLNGFDLVGVPGALNGISSSVISLNSITVTNGTVRGWPGNGIDLLTFAAFNCRVEGVSASENAGNGILAGAASVVLGCAARSNNASGILTGSGCVVTDCVAAGNGTNGIALGLDGTAANCVAHDNTASGFDAGAGCSLINCSASGNDASGIDAGTGSTVTGCTALTNTVSGISLGSGCTATGCTVNGNFGTGIIASSACVVVGCSSRSNTVHGITAVADCLLRGNLCSSNGTGGTGAGIRVTGVGNRIEANSCTGADIGIEVTAADNLIIQNSCAHNSANNWSVVINNHCLVVAGANAPAITGDSGGASPGSTNPNANYSY